MIVYSFFSNSPLDACSLLYANILMSFLHSKFFNIQSKSLLRVKFEFVGTSAFFVIVNRSLFSLIDVINYIFYLFFFGIKKWFFSLLCALLFNSSTLWLFNSARFSPISLVWLSVNFFVNNIFYLLITVIIAEQ